MADSHAPVSPIRSKCLATFLPPPTTHFHSIEIDLLFLESGRASFIPRRFDYGFVGLDVEPSPILEGLDENVTRIDRALMK